MGQTALGANALGVDGKNLMAQEMALFKRLGVKDSPMLQENVQKGVGMVQWIDGALEKNPDAEILKVVEATLSALQSHGAALESLGEKSGNGISRKIRNGQKAGDFRFEALLLELNQKVLAQEKIQKEEVGYLRIKNTVLSQIQAAFSLAEQRNWIVGYEMEMIEAKRLKMVEDYLTQVMNESGTDVVFEGSVERGFEKAIEEILKFLCEQIDAAQIELEIDVKGDGKVYVLQNLVGEVNPGKRTESTEAKYPINIKNSKGKSLVGEMIIKGQNLDESDKKVVEIVAAKLGTYTCQWRADFAKETQGIPPQVALLRKWGRLVEQSEEQLTMFYCDIYGFTAISEKFSKVTRRYGLKSGKLLELIEHFEGKHKELLGEIGCYDKLVGDCVIAHFGPPYEIDPVSGKKFDAFALPESERDPAFYAISALKLALNIRKNLPKFEEFFAELLYQTAVEIEALKPLSVKKTTLRKGKSEAEIRGIILEEFCEKHKFWPQLKVTQGFSTGFANVGLVRSGRENSAINYSSSYTVIGDEMNLAARLQSAAKPYEIIINAKTKELLDKALEENLAVPISASGKSETWKEFVGNYLGERAKKVDLVLDFEPTMLDLKNKEGLEVAYRLTINEIPKQQKTLEGTVKLTVEEFKKMEGKYVIATENNNEDVIVYYLENYFNRAEKFEVALNRTLVENRYIPQKDYDEWQSDERNCDDQIHVHDGKISVVNFISIENLIDEQIVKMDKGKETYEINEVPHTLYGIVNIHSPKDDDDYVEIELKKDKHTFFVRVDAENVQKLSSIQDHSSAKQFLDISTFPWVKKFEDPDQKRRLLSHPVFSPPMFFFLHVSGAYIGTLPGLEHGNGTKKTDLGQWFPSFHEEADNSGNLKNPTSMVPPSLK